MRATRSTILIAIVWTLGCSVTAGAQTKPARAAAKPIEKQPTRDEQIIEYRKEVRDYKQALQNPDIASDAFRARETNELLIVASCGLEALELPSALTQNPKFVEGLKAACSERLHGQAAPSGVAVDAPPPPRGGGSQEKAAANSACSMTAQPKPSGSDTKYSYTMQCAKDAKPNGIALSLAKAKPALTAAQTDEVAHAFAAALGTSAPPNDGTKGLAVLAAPAGGNPYVHTFEPTASSISMSSITVDYYIASGAVTDATACPSYPTNPGCSAGTISVAISKTQAAATCPTDERKASVEKPALNPVNPGSSSTVVSGTVAVTASGKVQLCSNGNPLERPVEVTHGSFSVTFDSSSKVKLTNGQKIQAQFTNQQNEAGEPTPDLVVGSCKLTAGKGTAPELSITPNENNKATFSGTLKGVNTGYVRICVNDIPTGAPVEIANGKFTGGTSLSLKADDTVAAQVCTGTACGEPFGPLSESVAISSGPLVAGKAADPNKPLSILIGGVEYGGYSSQAQTTAGFVEVFYRGPVTRGLAGWTRIRLTSAAKPATNGVVSVIANPTGLTTTDFANVGQVFDYSVGPSWKLAKYWALIASVGAITPLSSQNAPVVFKAPPPNTTECTTLLNRFSPKNGYNPGLTPNTATTPTTCVVNGATGVANIAFTNQDRSNFLLKYGAGIRTWYPLGSCKMGGASTCVPTYAAADITLGQDSSITGGLLRGTVFKIDGLLPIPMGNASWLYLFGSAYVRWRRNTDLAPLLLAAPTAGVSVPDPTVAVLPLVQPNRDYYRLGVGLNINQLWCKVYASSCPTNAQDSGTKNPTPSISKLNPANTKAGSAKDLTLTVMGSNFTTDSKIQWEGTELQGTQFISATELSVTVPKADLAKVTTAKVTVVNPSPGGASAAYEFQIQ